MVDRDKFSDYSKGIRFLDARIRVQAPSEATEPLPVDFEPGNWDVICQGGKDSYDHTGNRRFRLCIENNLPRYNQATSKHERSLVVTCIVDAILDSRTSEHGGFVRKDVASGRWYEVGDKTAREKVGHALRDAIKLKTREHQCHSIGSRDQDAPKHHSKKRRRAMDVPVSPRLATNSQVPDSKIAASQPFPEQSKEHIRIVSSASSAVVEAEWEISLKESTKQFQDSDDESESVNEDFPHGGVTVDKQLSNKKPSPIRSATKSFQPQSTMIQDAGKDTNASSYSWGPPGFSDLEDRFAQYMGSLGGLKDQTIEMKDTASTTPPFPKPYHHTVLEDVATTLGMPNTNQTAQSLPCWNSNLISDSDEAGVCL